MTLPRWRALCLLAGAFLLRAAPGPAVEKPAPDGAELLPQGPGPNSAEEIAAATGGKTIARVNGKDVPLPSRQGARSVLVTDGTDVFTIPADKAQDAIATGKVQLVGAR